MLGPFAQQYQAGVPTFTAQGISPFPGALQPQAFAQPFAANPFGNVAPNQFGGQGTFTPQPLQQIVQSLLIVPQQLQHLLQLAQIQQQQVQYLLQSIPQQLQQLQQQVLQQSGYQSITPHQAWGAQQAPFGIPQPFGAQPGHVM